MTTFTDTELRYLGSQPLGRLATVDAAGRPHVVPVGFFYDRGEDAIVIGGAMDMAASKKFRDAARRPDVALVVDDLASVDPWTPRGVEIRGPALTYRTGGEDVGRRLGAPFPFNPAYIRIRPRRILAWGLDQAIDEGPDWLTARDV
jgi:pyridoxamine 5'-phosphate oxidase family protein